MRDASPVVALGPSEQAIAQRLMDALDRFNADTTGIVDARELLVTELGENDELLGGLHGWSWGATCWIESLWVREDMRGAGLGGRLMGAVDDRRTVGHLQLTETAGTLEIKNTAVLESHQRRGIGRILMHAAIDLARDEGRAVLTVATASADIGNLRFYQRLGFRMLSVERDVFTPAFGYPDGLEVDGIPLRDRVWFDQDV